jgi:hypothetical protein
MKARCKGAGRLPASLPMSHYRRAVRVLDLDPVPRPPGPRHRRYTFMEQQAWRSTCGWIFKSYDDLVRGLEQAHRSALEDHVHLATPVGPRVLISRTWYKLSSEARGEGRPQPGGILLGCPAGANARFGYRALNGFNRPAQRQNQKAKASVTRLQHQEFVLGLPSKASLEDILIPRFSAYFKAGKMEAGACAQSCGSAIVKNTFCAGRENWPSPADFPDRWGSNSNCDTQRDLSRLPIGFTQLSGRNSTSFASRQRRGHPLRRWREKCRKARGMPHRNLEPGGPVSIFRIGSSSPLERPQE